MPSEPEPQSDADALEAAADDVIAACGGYAREAVKALIVANHFLETELEKARAARVHRIRAWQVGGNRRNAAEGSQGLVRLIRDPYIREKYTKGHNAAREQARDYFRRYPKDQYDTAVESWREIQAGNFEFTMRRLREPKMGRH